MRKLLNICMFIVASFWSAVSFAVATPVLEIDTGGHKAKIHEIIFSHDGRYLVSASEDKTLRVWDVKTGETVRVIRGETGGGFEGMLYAADLSSGDRLVASGGFLPGAGEGRFSIRLIDFRSGEVKGLLRGHRNAVLDL